MPVQIQTTDSIEEVEREIRSLEIQYQVSSAQFSARTHTREVAEFDAIEWEFLLMQRRAMEEDKCSVTMVFRAPSSTRISDVETSSILDKIAA